MAGPVDLVLLRGILPDVPLTPGTIVHGRVLDARTLVLAGVRLAAQLPEDVEPGQRLRLRVEESGRDRLHLRVVEAPPQQAEQAPAVPVSAYQLALPGGVMAQVYVQRRDDEDEGGGGAAGAGRPVVVRYDSPTLGRLDVRLDAVSAAVHVSAGPPAEAVRGAAAVLRDALARVSGGPVVVTVHPRDQALDVQA